jgi:hypothetical protein
MAVSASVMDIGASNTPGKNRPVSFIATLEKTSLVANDYE